MFAHILSYNPIPVIYTHKSLTFLGLANNVIHTFNMSVAGKTLSICCCLCDYYNENRKRGKCYSCDLFFFSSISSWRPVITCSCTGDGKFGTTYHSESQKKKYLLLPWIVSSMLEIIITTIELSSHLIPAIVLVAIFGKFVDLYNYPLCSTFCTVALPGCCCINEIHWYQRTKARLYHKFQNHTALILMSFSDVHMF